jgi:hypothetical protein
LIVLIEGQYDWKDGPSGNEAWMEKIDWPFRDDFNSQERLRWTVGGVDAGYAKEFNNLIWVVVSGAGHLAPMDQPEACYDMVKRTIRGLSFSTCFGNSLPLCQGRCPSTPFNVNEECAKACALNCPPDDGTRDDNSLSDGTIAGIAVGSVVGVGLVAGAVVNSTGGPADTDYKEAAV